MSYLDNSGVSYLWSKIKAAFAAKSHSHAAGDITSGTLPIANGGTGATTAADAVTNIVNGQDIRPNSISALSHISTDNGDLSTKQGAVYTIDGNIFTTKGNVSTSDGDIIASDGNIITYEGDVIIRNAAGTTYLHKLSEKANASHAHSASDITSGTLGISHGGTGLTANPSMLTNLGSTTADDVLKASPRPGITGTLAIGHGGTGLTSSPSMLTNLGSTSAANVLQASPRPGITGTLSVAHGGTGQTALIDEGTVANVATAGTNCVVSEVRVIKWGYVAMMYIKVQCNAALSSGAVIANVKSGYRPRITTILQNSASSTLFTALYNNGQLQLKANVTSGTNVYGMGTFILA